MLLRSMFGTTVFAALVAGGIGQGGPVFAGAKDGQELTVLSYAAENGDAWHALSLRAVNLPSSEPAARDHVVLVDTSASQVGEHRRQAHAVLTELLASLPSSDRVAIMAVDLRADALTEGFVAPGSESASKAALALDRRVPLGATDMQAALRSALEAIDKDRPASIIYIGDGMSTANLLQSSQMAELVGELAGRQVPVHSYAVGPETDLQLLGALALQTGGVVRFDAADAQRDDASAVARALAEAAVAPVFYPSAVSLNEGDAKLLPSNALPLRADRETIYLAKGRVAAGTSVAVGGTYRDKDLELNFTAGRESLQDGGSFLRAFWKEGESFAGLNVPFAGKALLETAVTGFDSRLAHLAAAGEQAVARRDLEQAEQIGQMIRKFDPSSGQANVLLTAAREIDARAVAQVLPPPADQPQDSLLNQVPPADIPPAPAVDGGIGQVEQLRRINEERLALEVSRTIEAARAIARRDPSGALAELKAAIDTVRQTVDINPGVRRDLLRRLETVRLEVTSIREQVELEQIQAAERLAQVRAREALNRQMALDEENLEMLIDRVRALIQEAIHGNDDAYLEARDVAQAAINLRPGEGTSTIAYFKANVAHQLNRSYRLTALHRERFLDTLHQVEVSAVPFPDEPPIRWPPAEVWRALTERRRKWASVDLHRDSPSEQKIQAALVDPRGVQVEFIDQPLREVIDFFGATYDIPIILNETALQEEGISFDEPVNKVISGAIPLRSALRIILEPIGLTYVIRNDVMEITTETEAAEILSTRVYPVADLVVPIPPPGALGGGMGGGMMGGGMMGGMGGGMMGGGMGGGMMGGGMGGGMMGGGMGGMGGGFFSVADPPVSGLEGKTGSTHPVSSQPFAQVRDPQPFRLDNRAVESRKKKP